MDIRSRDNKKSNIEKSDNKAEVAFSSERLKAQFEKLENGRFEDKILYDSIISAIDEIRRDPLCGTAVKKELWPKKYISEYKITNLRKYNLTKSWRLIYTIKSNEIMVISIILEWFSDHKDYEKRFKY